MALYPRPKTPINVMNEKKASTTKKNAKKREIWPKIPRDLLRDPVDRSGWVVAHFSCRKLSFNPVSSFFLHLKVFIHLNVSDLYEQVQKPFE